tara:strand:- start:627 stop:881 length:255 start_codon:yes stop_codon:yes gene_type:complete
MINNFSDLEIARRFLGLVTEDDVFLAQAPNFNFELDAGELVAEGLKRGFLCITDQRAAGEKLYQINFNYQGSEPATIDGVNWSA